MRLTLQQVALCLIFLLSILLIVIEIRFYIFYDGPWEESLNQGRKLEVIVSIMSARELYRESLSLPDIDNLAEDFSKGQSIFKPAKPSGERVTFLVPYRDRKQELLAFLMHMTAYMRIRGTKYEIVIIEQSDRGKFNRAKLFNAALKEIFNAETDDRLYGSTCFAFHDVDKIPISQKTLYQCAFQPIQVLRYVHYKTGGKQMYRNTLGGITLFTRDHLEAMNGASNSFEGWGGEDDDLYKRVFYIHQRPRLVRFDEGQFYEEDGDSHFRDKSEDRYKVLKKSSRLTMIKDGLRQVKYTLVERKDFNTFIWMKFDF